MCEGVRMPQVIDKIGDGGGYLGQDMDENDLHIVCPWHAWKFHRASGVGEPGFEEDCVPSFPLRLEGGRLQINLGAPTRRRKKPHPPHPLERDVVRAPGPLRLAGISTTVMDRHNPRFSGSDHLLAHALQLGLLAGRRVARRP